MVPQGPPPPLNGTQSVTPSLLRSNSGMLGGQGGGIPSQNAFPSLVSPRSQFAGMNMLGNASNVSSLLHQPFGNGISGSGHGSSQRGLIDGGVESVPLSGVGNVMGFNSPSSSYISSPVVASSNSSGQVLGQQQFLNTLGGQVLSDQQQLQHLDLQNSQHSQQPFSVPNGMLQQQQQQQFQSTRSALGGVGPVKLEPQSMNDQASQHLQALRNIGPVKLEPQQLQSMRSLGPVKMEPQHSDPSLFLQQQQQQLLMSRQSPQAAAAAQMFHQQRMMQMQQQQHQQQQQFLKTIPHQRSPIQQQFPPQNLPLRSPVKQVYEPGMCARRLTHYMYQQQHRPEDNNIEFWRKFVAEYFAPNAKKKWCVSLYGSGRQTYGVFPQDVWHCEICNRKPGRGFEATYEVLPRLFKIKYESGTVEELLYVDMPREYQNPSGQIVLDYTKALQESVFEQLRVVREGHLRIVFSPDLKICSWEFCARRHEELIPRRLLIPQVGQLGAAAQKYQTAATQNASTGPSVSDLQNSCNMFVASARQLAKALEVPLVNDLGYTKRYVRCLQISEVVNSMKDLIDYSREMGAGPMESLTKFPRRTNSPSTFQAPRVPEGPPHQPEQHQAGLQNSNGDNPAQAPNMQLPAATGTQGINNNLNPASSSSASSNAAGVLHQNSMNSRPIPGANGSYGGNGVHMPSPGSSTNLQQGQLSVSPFQSPAPSSSNNPQPTTYSSLSGANVNSASLPNVSVPQPALSGDADTNDTQSSVQKIIHDLMMSSQFNGNGMMGMETMGGDVKNANGILSSSVNPVMSSGNVLVGTGVTNGNTGFGSRGNGLGHSAMVNGIQSVHGNHPVPMRGGVGLGIARDQGISSQQQQDMSNQLQLLNGLGAANGFNNFHFDWKPSP